MSGNVLPSQYSLTPAQLSALPSARFGTNPLTQHLWRSSGLAWATPQGLGLIAPKYVRAYRNVP